MGTEVLAWTRAWEAFGVGFSEASSRAPWVRT